MQTIKTTAAKDVATGIVYIVALLFPIFFIPFTADFFDLNKTMLLVVSTGALLLSWACASILRKSLRITLSPVLAPAALFTGAVVVSSLFAAPNRIEAFTGKALLYIVLFLFFTIGSHMLRIKRKELPFMLLILSGAILTVVSILQALGIGLSQILNSVLGLQIPNSIVFSLAGSSFATMLFLVPVAIASVVEMFSVRGMEKKGVYAVASGVLLVGILLNGYFMLPGKIAQPQFLPFRTSWSIMLESMKNPTSAFLGVGPESYINAFTQFRPADYNMLPQWNIRYVTARNEVLQIVTSLGIIGLVTYLFFVLMMVKLLFPLKEETRPFAIIILTTLVFQLVFPASYVQMILLYTSLLFVTAFLKAKKDERVTDMILHMFAVRLIAPEKEQKPATENASVILAYAATLVVVVGFGVSAFFLGKAYASEIIFYQSLVAAQKNDGLKTYNLQAQAVALSPSNDRFRRSFASTNFALAKGMAENPDLTDADRENVSGLIQQAIEQGKVAVSLDQGKTANWETLSSIYRNLIGTAQGADQWAIASIVQAIRTEPTNPGLRFDLGGVYLTLENYDQAQQLFQQAVDLKPDWANAYYNLGFVYEQKKDVLLALNAYAQALQLLPESSTDREALQKK